MKRRIVWMLLLVSAASGGWALRGADAPAGGAASDVIATGDLLVLSIPNFAGQGGEYLKPVRVAADGTVPLPLLPDPMKVAGRSLAEAEQGVNRALSDAKYIAAPAVSIDRIERGESASVAPGPIAAGDVVRLSISDLFSPGVRRVRYLHVSPGGNIGLPVLGQTKVAGMTEAQAEAAVAKAYVDAKVLNGTIVSVLRVKLPPGPERIPDSLQPAMNRK